MTERDTVEGCDVVDGWFERQRNTLLRGLDSLLDVEAGLCEIMLQPQNDTMTASLNSLLDVESGLAAVIPRRSRPEKSEPIESRHQELLSEKFLLTVMTPPDRIVLRRNPAVVQSLEILKHLPSLEQVLLDAQENAQRLEYSTFADRNVKVEMAFTASISFGFSTRSIATLIADMGDFVHASIDEDVALALRESVHSSERLTAVISLAREAAEKLNFHREKGEGRRLFGPSWRNFLAIQMEYEQASELTESEVRHHVGELREIVTRLTQKISHFSHACRHRVRHILACETGVSSFPSITLDELRMFLDDFTEADLRDAKLLGVDLAGVRWSVHETLWPAAVDVEHLKTLSDEVISGSGIYVIRAGTATIRELAELN